MTLRYGFPAKLAPTDANDARYDLRNLIVRNSNGSVRSGLTSPAIPGYNVLTATATTGPMTTSVGGFDAVAERDTGVVLLSNIGTTSVSHAPAPVANSRIDVVYAMQHDASSTVSIPDADNLAGIYVAQGAAASLPVKPAIPNGAVELGTVQIPAGATATNSSGVVITQTYQYTAPMGSSVPFLTLAALQLWTNPTAMQRARVIGEAANNDEYVWGQSAAWIRTFEGSVAPLARVSRVAAFSTSGTPSTYLAIPWDTEAVNAGGGGLTHSTATNPSRFTAQVAGYYRIKGNARINTTSGSGNALIAKNGTQSLDTLFSVTPAAGTTPFVTAEDIVQMNVGDYVEFMVASNIATVTVSNASASFTYIEHL